MRPGNGVAPPSTAESCEESEAEGLVCGGAARDASAYGPPGHVGNAASGGKIVVINQSSFSGEAVWGVEGALWEGARVE